MARQSFSSAMMIKGWKPGDKPREIWIKRGAAASSGGKHKRTLRVEGQALCSEERGHRRDRPRE